MKKLLALVASLLLVASFATPAQSAGAKYTVYQKTLSAFSSTATTLTSQQKAQVKVAVDANPAAEKFICTGIRYYSQPMSVNIMVRKRAKAACEYAKQLNPNLSTWFQNKPTQARSYAGKVLLTVKTLEGGSSTAADRTSGNQAGYLVDGPETWLNSTAKKAGAKCTSEGERVVANNRALECRRVSLVTLRWIADSSAEPYSSKANPSGAKEGTACYRPGDKINNSAGYLECRYVAGRKLQFIQLSGSNDAPTSAAGLANVEMCKMRDQRSVIGGGGSTAFPMQYNRIQTAGIVDVAVVPIDFPDSDAPGKPADLLQEHIDAINKRNEEIFGNRIQYRWHIPEEWQRMSRNAEYYNQDHQTVQADGTRKSDGTKTLLTKEEQLTEIYTEAEKVLDIAAMDFIFLYSNPYEPDVQFGPGYYEDITTATTTYRSVASYPLGYWAFNGHFTKNGVSLASWMGHEIQHFHGMVQHAPGNGTQWYEGMPSTWESWVAGWRPDSEFACVDATSTTNAEVKLSSMDLPSSGYKAVVVKVSSTEILVVESRRDGIYNPMTTPGIAGITVYNVDATKAGDRWDGNASKELDYYAYFLRNNRGTYPKLVGGPNMGDTNVMGYEGDSFTYRGITVTLSDSGDFDTVTISSATGATPQSFMDRNKFVLFDVEAKEEDQPTCGCCGCFPGANLH